MVGFVLKKRCLFFEVLCFELVSKDWMIFFSDRRKMVVQLGICLLGAGIRLDCYDASSPTSLCVLLNQNLAADWEMYVEGQNLGMGVALKPWTRSA